MGSFSLWHWLIVLIVLPLHFLPSIIAFKRDHAQKVLVLLINLLTGWTGIGWIVAFIWALVGKPAADRAAFIEFD